MFSLLSFSVKCEGRVPPEGWVLVGEGEAHFIFFYILTRSTLCFIRDSMPQRHNFLASARARLSRFARRPRPDAITEIRKFHTFHNAEISNVASLAKRQGRAGLSASAPVPLRCAPLPHTPDARRRNGMAEARTRTRNEADEENFDFLDERNFVMVTMVSTLLCAHP